MKPILRTAAVATTALLATLAAQAHNAWLLPSTTVLVARPLHPGRDQPARRHRERNR